MSVETEYLIAQLKAGRNACRQLARTESKIKNDFLYALADSLKQNSKKIEIANWQDYQQARIKNMSPTLLDRLLLNQRRIDLMIKGIVNIALLDDPVGQIITNIKPPNGLNIYRIRIPLGMIAVIYESRPNVTIDAAALCFKSGNSVMLRGGTEAQKTNNILVQIFKECLKRKNLSEFLVQYVRSQDRELVGQLLRAQGLIDVIIPRGGKNLIERVINEARVPVFAHLEGIVHLYVDYNVNAEMAIDIIINSKMRRTGICGAAECLLLHQDIDENLIKHIFQKLIDVGCEIRGDERSCSLDPRVNMATLEDYGREFLGPVIAVKFVVNQIAAEDHIAHYGSSHTDVIITDNQIAAKQFFNNVDSAIIIHNASSQFADGNEFGMGAEIGIATGRMHARGPVGLEQLTTFHYQVHGDGQTRPV